MKRYAGQTAVLRIIHTGLPSEVKEQQAKIKRLEDAANGCFMNISDIGDSAKRPIDDYFDQCFTFIEEALKKRMKVLIHCQGGTSRSPAIMAAYLMRKYALTADQALNHITHQRPSVDTNFKEHLARYEIKLREKKPDNQVEEFMQLYRADYIGGCFSFFHKTNLNAYTTKGLDAERILAHARVGTFFGFFKNRTRKILEEMKVMDENGKFISFDRMNIGC